VSRDENTLAVLRRLEQLLQTMYESPSLASQQALPLIDAELPGLRDAIELLEQGVVEWRQKLQAKRHAEAARATARIAISHLQAVLNSARTHADQQAADDAARDWLISIGSDPA